MNSDDDIVVWKWFWNLIKYKMLIEEISRYVKKAMSLQQSELLFFLVLCVRHVYIVGV